MTRLARRTRWVVWPASLVLAMTIIGELPALAAGPWAPPKPADVAGIPAVDGKPRRVPSAWTAESRAVRGPQRVSWPGPGSAIVDLAAPSLARTPDGSDRAAKVRIRAGSLPVTLAASTSSDATARVAVTMHDRAVARRAGREVLMSLARPDGLAGRVSVQLSYAGFAHAYGGDYASRLRLVTLPPCALTTPTRSQCRRASPVSTRNDRIGQTLTGEVAFGSGGGPMLLSTSSEASSDNGDHTATSLAPAGTWQVSQQTGAFSWSYPLRMPPALGGPAPSLSLAYSSGSIDGRTATTNNQGSWIGDGWDSWPGFIERKYASCADDNPSHKTGDQCWFNDNASLSLNGHAGELIKDGSVWRLKDDDATKVERLTDDARVNGDDNNEYWKVTTTDGWQYYFGYHRLPDFDPGDPVTNSTWTVPVNGNNSGEPCHAATFAASFCDQAWRWNLDYVVDPHDNTMALFYTPETGAYGKDNTPSLRVTYHRGGYLDRIEYGLRHGAEASQAAPLRVKFTTAERCLSGCWTGAAWTSDPVTSAWPDTPWDQYCASAPCNDQGAPTFWTARRLTKVTTQVRNGTSTYRDVESWTLRQEFINAGTGESTPMWLRGITRTGHVTTAGGAEVSDPEITFDPGEPLPNRVDGPGDGRTALNRFRVKQVATESGGVILVTYSGPDCTPTTLPDPENNTKRCMPAFYAPAGQEPSEDWFHKYVVNRVDLYDGATDQPNQTTFYDYLDSPAWHYNTDEITKDKYRTWGEWRGYGRVQIRTGDPTNTPQTAVEYRYLRGMHGDHLPGGATRNVTVTDSWGGNIVDHEALQGFLLQQITLNGPGGAEVSSTRNDPLTIGPTATRTRNGITTNAWMVNTETSRTRTALAPSGFRYAKTTTAYNNDGLPTTTDDFGAEDITGDEICTRLTYARNDTTWMIDKVAQTETLSGTCAAAATPATPNTVLSRQRTFYDAYTDESSFGAAPTEGDIVRTEDLDHWTGTTPVYVRTASATYDSNGRATTVIGARGNTTQTLFTTAHGGLVTATTVTNALSHAVTTETEPAWGQPTRLTDPNGIVTDMTYDGLGRLTNVWLPGRNKANQTASLKFTYLVRKTGGPTAVTTEALLPTGAAYKKSINLLDGFLRQRQNQTQATGGGRVVTETFHDSAGRTAWISASYYDSTNTNPSTDLAAAQGQIPSITTYGYDGAGRTTDEILLANGVEQWRITTGYGGDRVHTTPPVGGTATTSITDVRGSTVTLRQYKNPTDVGSTDPSKYVQTTYAYNLLRQLTGVTDPAGNQWTYTYDLRGRQTQTVEPDRGTTTTTHDEAGNVVTVTAPLDTGTATTAYTYDALNRKTTMRDDNVTGAIRAQWVYDTLTNGIGKLTSATRRIGTDDYITRVNSYDTAGRMTSASVVLPASQSALCAAPAPNTCTYTTTQSYRANGQPFQTGIGAIADLPAETLTTGWNDIGDPAGLLSAGQVQYTLTYNKIRQITQHLMGAFGSRVAVTSTYDEPTRRLTNTNVVPELQAEAANWSYTYDDVGHVTKIVEAPQGQTADRQCFRYDYVGRLTTAWTPNSDNCTANPTLATLGGPAPYWHDWEFDLAGNRTKETRHAATNTEYTYAYPAAGTPRPHAVTSVTATGGVSWTRNYTYDNAGRTKTRPNATGGTQNLTFDREGRLTTQVDGTATTTYIYDADGNRLVRTDATGKTLYLSNGTEVRYDNATATKKATRFYTCAGLTVAVRTATSLHWIIGDHHGTAELAIKSDTLAVAKRRTLPYGELRGATSGTWATAMDKGFVGGTQDPTGLTHLGAREYDPTLGRFISVDPIFDISDPQSWNPYGYAGNAPVTSSDPSGLMRDDSTGGGGSSGPTNDSTGGCDDVHVYGQSSCQANRSGGGRADKGPRIVETVTYPNGTVLAEYSNGAYAVNGYVLPFYIEDPYQLARVADAELSKLGAIDDELLRTLLALSGACNTGEAGCQGFHLAAINDDLRAYSSMLRGAKSETTDIQVQYDSGNIAAAGLPIFMGLLGWEFATAEGTLVMSGRAELTGKVLTLRDFSIYGVKNGQMLERGAMNARNVFQAIRAFTRFASVQGGVQVVRIEGVRNTGPTGTTVRLQAQINSSAPGGVSISRGWRN